VFLVPGLIFGAIFGLWQVVLVLQLGMEKAAENFTALRAATAGAAAVFSPDAMERAVRQLLSFNTYGGALVLALASAIYYAVPRRRDAQQWGILVLFGCVNFAWYVIASVGWPRYAFSGLALAALFVARLVDGVFSSTRGATFDPHAARGLRVAFGTWVVFVAGTSLASTIRPVVWPPANAPAQMSAFLNKAIGTDVLIETWEPELGALTNHNYHYPPARLLNVAVRHIWLQGPAPKELYKPLEQDPRPAYVVVGAFARWVDVYPQEVLTRDYDLVTRVGGYELYRSRGHQLARVTEKAVR
jgi:hypothetical protein